VGQQGKKPVGDWDHGRSAAGDGEIATAIFCKSAGKPKNGPMVAVSTTTPQSEPYGLLTAVDPTEILGSTVTWTGNPSPVQVWIRDPDLVLALNPGLIRDQRLHFTRSRDYSKG
jgi:hypothetical protein